MTTWQDEIASALDDFCKVAQFARAPIARAGFTLELLAAPHRAPTKLPAGRAAVYGFFWRDGWLKIGHAGPNSQARYISQHYNAGSAPSTLAASLLRDGEMTGRCAALSANPGEWIKANCDRANILLPIGANDAMRRLLEAFLQVRFNPKYEG